MLAGLSSQMLNSKLVAKELELYDDKIPWLDLFTTLLSLVRFLLNDWRCDSAASSLVDCLVSKVLSRMRRQTKNKKTRYQEARAN